MHLSPDACAKKIKILSTEQQKATIFSSYQGCMDFCCTVLHLLNKDQDPSHKPLVSEYVRTHTLYSSKLFKEYVEVKPHAP